MNPADRPNINGIPAPNPDDERSTTRRYLIFASLLFQSTLCRPKRTAGVCPFSKCRAGDSVPAGELKASKAGHRSNCKSVFDSRQTEVIPVT
jgi:hypothetical protein